MSGNICRCAAYPNIRAAIRAGPRRGGRWRMRPLSYSRATDVDDAIALVGGDPASAFLAGGTTEVDLIRAGIAPSDHLVDINDLPLDRGRGSARRRPAHRRAGADERRRPAPGRRRALPGDLAGAAAGRLGAAAQHGLDGRQPAPADPLRVPPRRRVALQQARPGHAAARRSTGSTAATPILGTSEHCIATHPVGRRGRARRVRRRRPHAAGPAASARIADRRLLPAARRHARASSTRSSTAS